MRDLALLLLLALLVPGCASDGGDGRGADALSDVPPGTRLQAHGCSFDAATDMTGRSTVILTDLADWRIGHVVCLHVDVGTAVTWEGNFDAHPLQGGIAGTRDASSPIDAVGPGSGSDPVTVTFSSAGDFPYYCGIHTTSMIGVVYVGG